MGIGYRADVKGKIATFTLGYSHPIEVLSARRRRSEDRQADAPGADAGTTSRWWARWRPTCARCVQPDPYKNKGIRYTGEALRKKVGKTGRGRQDESWQAIRKERNSQRIHTRIRRKVAGTAERPRLAVFRSVKHIYAQVIDDTEGAHAGRGFVRSRRAARRRRQCGGGQGDRQAGRRARQGKGHQERWCSTAAAICITAASRRWPMRRAKRDWSSN